jgi:ABC-type Fe3+ transport system substrate-binding protein
MSLFDDLKNEELLKPLPASACSVCSLIQDLPEPEAKQLVKVLADPTVSKSAVARVLTNNGHKIAPGTITRHARGECAKRA